MLKLVKNERAGGRGLHARRACAGRPEEGADERAGVTCYNEVARPSVTRRLAAGGVQRPSSGVADHLWCGDAERASG